MLACRFNIMEDGEDYDEDIMDKIQIYSNDDEQLKFLGQILGNESSRKILQTLFDKELTAGEISTQTGFSLPLINHHISTMLQAGVVAVTKTTMNTKNQPMKHYSAKSGIVILPKQASKKAKASKRFSKSIKQLMQITTVGAAAIASFFITLISQPVQEGHQTGENLNVIDSPFVIPSVIALVVIGIGLLVKFVLNQRKNKKK